MALVAMAVAVMMIAIEMASDSGVGDQQCGSVDTDNNSDKDDSKKYCDSEQ